MLKWHRTRCSAMAGSAGPRSCRGYRPAGGPWHPGTALAGQGACQAAGMRLACTRSMPMLRCGMAWAMHASGSRAAYTDTVLHPACQRTQPRVNTGRVVPGPACTTIREGGGRERNFSSLACYCINFTTLYHFCNTRRVTSWHEPCQNGAGFRFNSLGPGLGRSVPSFCDRVSQVRGVVVNRIKQLAFGMWSAFVEGKWV